MAIGTRKANKLAREERKQQLRQYRQGVEARASVLPQFLKDLAAKQCKRLERKFATHWRCGTSEVISKMLKSDDGDGEDVQQPGQCDIRRHPAAESVRAARDELAVMETLPEYGLEEARKSVTKARGRLRIARSYFESATGVSCEELYNEKGWEWEDLAGRAAKKSARKLQEGHTAATGDESARDLSAAKLRLDDTTPLPKSLKAVKGCNSRLVKRLRLKGSTTKLAQALREQERIIQLQQDVHKGIREEPLEEYIRMAEEDVAAVETAMRSLLDYADDSGWDVSTTDRYHKLVETHKQTETRLEKAMEHYRKHIKAVKPPAEKQKSTKGTKKDRMAGRSGKKPRRTGADAIPLGGGNDKL